MYKTFKKPSKIALFLLASTAILFVFVAYLFHRQPNTQINLFRGEKKGVEITMLGLAAPDELVIKNLSKFPIQLNYYSDQYYYKTKEGNYYQLKLSPISFLALSAVLKKKNSIDTLDSGNISLDPEKIAPINFESDGDYEEKFWGREVIGFLVVLESGGLKVELTKTPNFDQVLKSVIQIQDKVRTDASEEKDLLDKKAKKMAENYSEMLKLRRQN